MFQVPIFINVRSEYTEHDSSRYRLSLTENVLVPSLKNQASRGFAVFLQQSPMDPFFKKRERAFRSVTDRVIPMHEKEGMILPARIEITVGDDDFLGPHFIERLRAEFRPSRGNVQMHMPHGYIFFDGKLHPWRNKEDLMEITQYGNPDSPIVRHEGFEVSTMPEWIYVRHSMNSNPVSPSAIDGFEVKLTAWSGWKQNIVQKYCQTQVLTATANGCQLHPTRSKAMMYAKGSARSRRK